MSDRLITLLSRLNLATEQGDLNWEELPGEEFSATFSGYAVGIEQGALGYVLTIYDDDGNIVESVAGKDSIFRDLFRAARRVARGIDEALNSILSQLPNDDELPF
ncbi:MAG: hypothetical protein JJ896_08985 [Rhodothermales bacterium]|nr:hypothetical protein [Rhodothermales bacterium]MBO6779772.1 hypothetical protein [Rhodothermales bacterium]